MTPTEALAYLKTLPAEHREPMRAALSGAFQEGFLRGVAKLGRVDPFQAPPSEATIARKKR